MRSISRALVITALAVSLPATLVLAQSVATDSVKSSDRHERVLEGQFALVKTTLKLDDAQLKLWAPVEEKLRATEAKRAEARNEWREKRKQRRSERSGEAAKEDSGSKADRSSKRRVSLPDRLERQSEFLTKRAEALKSFAGVLKPFYESLNDEQKVLVGPVMRDFKIDGMRGHGPGHGPRWAGRGWDKR